MASTPSASIEARLDIPEGTCALTYEHLDVQAIIQSVTDDAAGATAVFIGTTRDSFKGKVVTRLDYQAYSKLAIKTMADIIRNAHSVYTRSEHHIVQTGLPPQSLIRSAVHHRLGTVPVGEPSIVIAVSSPHRKEAFMACEHILEEVKLKAQIWKREFYEGEREEDAEWKANAGH
ncbi:molybdenum cofactor synthesis 2 [Lentinus brumalis]|uniref:Molybdenum cofactor synthesis 2 n=1 Tax=Lentinus brumalis TaxID=2498619 RepID=A0A371DTE4_9APHY|nr:molybdenum cofactor synthesis 2 [Polyporus brumalis]